MEIYFASLHGRHTLSADQILKRNHLVADKARSKSEWILPEACGALAHRISDMRRNGAFNGKIAAAMNHDGILSPR